jgi:signal transduction histidine kinase
MRIEVVDDGPGVASDVDVFRLFETTKALGTGIGLAVAKQIVLAHGGGIEFANVDPHGAAFTIELPVGGAAADTGRSRD